MKRFQSTVLLLAICLSACSRGEPTIEQKVKSLVDQLVIEKTQEQASQDLVELGEEAVPHIVKHLTDYRPLPWQHISLENNFPNSFEGIRHYNPEVVHDALSAILNQITSVHFEFVYNGAPQEVRVRNAQHWTKWCNKNYPKP